MGVRFECPAGHKLHVKAHLAGQRGICPECGVRFIVPSFSGGRVAEAPGADAGARSAGGHVSVLVESATSFERGLSDVAGPDGDDAQDSVAWYVRPAGGGQFGPVDAAAFGQWIDEGRVAADSWVWRTGWDDWKPGTEALRAFAAPGRGVQTMPSAQLGPPAKRGAATRSPTFDADLDEVLAAPRNGRSVTPVASGVEKPVTTARAAQLRRRKQLNQWLTVGLAVMALVLLTVLVVVLTRSEKTPPTEGDAGTPASTSTP